MKKIHLKCGNAVIIDDEYESLINKYSWRSYFDGWNWYVRRSTTINKKVKTILLHREIMGVTESMILIDHIDRNGLNNQKSNLRKCTHSENSKNKKGWGTSSYLGVSLKTTKYKYKVKNGEDRVSICKRWEARIQHNKKQISIGFFDTEEEAALAYNEKAINLHGEFANINILKK